MAERLLHQSQALRDQLAMPQDAVLILERHDLAVRIEPRRRPRMLQQKQRRQPHNPRFGRKQPEQQPGESDRFFAQRDADVSGAPARRIALVEHQIDHGRDGGDPLGSLDRAGRLIRNPRIGDAAFRPGDALFHGALADQESARDLLDRKSGHDAQRSQASLLNGLLGLIEIVEIADVDAGQNP
jgi:hypothetical protein